MRIRVYQAPTEAKSTGLDNETMPTAIHTPGGGYTPVRVICTCTSATGIYSRIGDTTSTTALDVLQNDQVVLGVNEGTIINLDEISRTTFDGDWIFSMDKVEDDRLI
jgi:hypothetical protein